MKELNEDSLGMKECIELAMWESEYFNKYKGYCIKKAYTNMIKKQVDYEYRGIKGFFKLLIGR